MRAQVNKVLEVLRNKSLKEEAKRERLRVIYGEMFDQEELSKWCLGRNWNRLSEDQRKEFLPLFQQVLEKTYGDRILAYSDEKIVFDRELPIANNRVEVQTRPSPSQGDPSALPGLQEQAAARGNAMTSSWRT